MRFPAAADEPAAAVCPLCGSPTEQQVEAAHSTPQVANPNVQPRLQLVLLLDNLRSIYNVGSIFRTADGAGVAHLHLGGITATPNHPKLAKTALGAAHQDNWTYYRSGVLAADKLLTQGYTLWALEISPTSRSLYDVSETDLPEKLALVVGNEVAGVDPAILARCAQTIALPMMGVKESLNVTIACGAAVYHLLYGCR